MSTTLEDLPPDVISLILLPITIDEILDRILNFQIGMNISNRLACVSKSLSKTCSNISKNKINVDVEITCADYNRKRDINRYNMNITQYPVTGIVNVCFATVSHNFFASVRYKNSVAKFCDYSELDDVHGDIYSVGDRYLTLDRASNFVSYALSGSAIIGHICKCGEFTYDKACVACTIDKGEIYKLRHGRYYDEWNTYLLGNSTSVTHVCDSDEYESLPDHPSIISDCYLYVVKDENQYALHMNRLHCNAGISFEITLEYVSITYKTLRTTRKELRWARKGDTLVMVKNESNYKHNMECPPYEWFLPESHKHLAIKEYINVMTFGH